MNIKIDINVCRVCLRSGSGVSLLKETALAEKFQKSTQLQIIAGDGLPETLCNKCVVRLKIAYDFKKQSEVSEQHLRSFIVEVNNKFNQVTAPDDEYEVLLDNGYQPEQEQEEEPETIVDHMENDQKHEESEDDKVQVLEMITFQENAKHDDVLPMEEEESMEQEEQIEQHEEEQEGEEEEVEHEYEDEIIDMVDEEEEHIEEEHLEEGTYVDSQQVYIITENVVKSQSKPRIKIESGSNICTKCNKDFSTKTNLVRHMQTHDGRKPYQCNICGNSFTQNGSLKQHMHIHTGERPFTCEVCNRGFTQSKSLVFHMRRHTGEKPFTCSVCGLSFRQKDGLKRHESVRHAEAGVRKYPCEICSKLLNSKYSLYMHMKKHVEGSSSGYKCEICDKSFASKASLQNHTRQHTGEKPFKCTECPREFTQKSSLMAHMKQHLTDKPYLCNVCGKGFLEKHQIKAHMNVHNNKPSKYFKCNICSKSFTIKRSFLSHMQSHNDTEGEIFKCEECNIGFNTNRGLKLHRNNQHKENVTDLNTCDFCHMPFISVTDLNAHILAEHDAIEAKCEICNQDFDSKKLFEEHKLEHDLVNLKEE